MFAICIESSHKKGMGHFFRMLNFVAYLTARGEKYIVLINEDEVSNRILKEQGLPFRVVDLNDTATNWETSLIKEYGISIWLNDRLETNAAHAENVRANGICLVTIDDLGPGASRSHIHFAAMPCIFRNNPQGEKVYAGIEYIILNEEIEKNKRLRDKQDKILVTLGGSDTYGATVKVAATLKGLSKQADIIVGPSFAHMEELREIADGYCEIKHYVPSLIAEFANYDLAVTGGGLTPFEANASGLPCIVVANEPHEIENAAFLDDLGSSLYAGFYDNIDVSAFSAELDIAKMSGIGLNSVKTSAVQAIYKAIK
jgi:spore coat polysaccharide biosynthesis predicted glycosyltransferase SpsG